ncbi:MAG: hypothetical protein ACR2M5_10170 [Nakamurella sp.]
MRGRTVSGSAVSASAASASAPSAGGGSSSGWRDRLRQALAAADPRLALGAGRLQRVRATLPGSANGRTVAVIGRVPGSGTSTVVASMALAAAGYTGNRVVVVETNRSDPAAGARRVTTLLGGIGNGRLPTLLGVPGGEAVARRRLRAASTPGSAVPVLELPPRSGNFAPQVLEQTLARLRQRADLIILDTPSDRSEPVYHAVLHLVDHVLLVLPADRSAPERLAAARRWLAATPGPARRHSVSVVLVARSRFVPRWRPGELPWVLLRRDGALRRGTVGRMSRRSLVAALQLVGAVSG